MKLISRKSLVAVACSAAMITGATVAPAMAADATATTTPATSSADLAAGAKGSSDDKPAETTGNNNAGNQGSAATPKEMGEWAKAIAAIISTLTAIWTFVQKFLLKK